MTGGKGMYRRKFDINVTKEVGDTENKACWFHKPNIMHDVLLLLGYYSFFKLPLPIYILDTRFLLCSLMCDCHVIFV